MTTPERFPMVPGLGGEGQAMDAPSAGRPERLAGRIAFEGVLRAIAVGSLLWALWEFVAPAARASAVVTDARLSAALPRWTVGQAPAHIALELTGLPDPVARDWLADLARTGSIVTWRPRQGRALAGAAIEVAAVADPIGRVRELVAAPSGTRVAVHDDLGELAAAVATGGGVTLEGPPPSGLAAAIVARGEARAALGDSLIYRPVLVIGRIGWESKFLIDALEGDGWTVQTRLTLTPRASVIRGPRVALDTGHVAAVIVVGEPAAIGLATLDGYVRS